MDKKLNELTLIEAIEGLKNKKFTSVALVSACLDQIEKYDDRLKAFITVLPKETLLKFAQQADDLINKEGVDIFHTQPLLGIPYACKDNFCTRGIKTTASSKVLENFIPTYESTVTMRLGAAGAILLGKTNMDAFAHGSSTENSDFFTTKNPWDLSRVPGGSSGGSAVAVASNMCTFAIGSETAGSIRGPASWSGITGLKPTYGRVSRYGAIAMASSTDSPGPLTKTALDSSYVLNVIAGKDPLDATSSSEEVQDYYSLARDFDLKGLKIGRAKQYFEIDLEEGVRQACDNVIKKFQELGAEVIDIDIFDPKYSISVYTILQRAEVSSNLARYDGIRFGNDRSAFGLEAKKRMMLGAYVLSVGYYDAYYAKAQKVRTMIVDDFNKAFERVDLIIGPTMPCVAVKAGAAEDSSSMFGEKIDVLQEPSSIAGLTGVSIPCGFSEGMPVGIQLIGRQFDESKVLGAAVAYQQNTDYHKNFAKEESWES
jgi:aspartyl-tRNA(Asn)/glutamyl-tRNA(Gln) amidotransferase subunit A